jgi:MoaA/NifB/PqqE/SkfB family radical SAM enzyme
MNSSNFKRFTGIIFGRRAFAGPIWVQIDLTNMCNNNCIGCWCNSPLLEEKRMSAFAKKQTLSFDVIKKLIDDLKDIGTERVFLCGGGEPTLHPDIKEIIVYVK